MKSVMNFLEKYGLILIFVLILVQTCVSSSNKRMSEKKVLNQLDSVRTEIKNLKTEIKIEGLKSEKRMIQSTDRKILDVNRQTDIDKEIEKLQKD